MRKGKRERESADQFMIPLETASDDTRRPDTTFRLEFPVLFQKQKLETFSKENSDSQIAIFALLWVLIARFLCQIMQYFY